jgi:hypothetical protein
MLQAERTGMSPQEAKERITGIWQRTDNGAAFAIALWEEGFALCRGDRRDFVAIDPKGGTHSLARRVDGAKTKDIRARMADLDPAYLPSVTEGKAMQAQRRLERGAEHVQEKPREPSKENLRDTPNTDRKQTRQTLTAASRAADGFGRAAGAILDGFASIFERGLSGGDEAQADREKEQEPPVRDDEQRADPTHADAEAKSQIRQALLREFGKNIANEQEAEFERERTRR